jgi:hypothetical protein
MSTLIDDLIIYCFDFLTDQTLITKLSLVNKHWYRLVTSTKQTWWNRTLKITVFMGEPNEHALNMFQRCEIAHFQIQSRDWIDVILCQQNNVIQSLNVGFLADRGVDVDLSLLCAMELNDFDRLKCINFLHAQPFHLDLLNMLLPRSLNLEQLYFTMPRGHTNVVPLFDNILKLKHLKRLSLNRCLVTEKFLTSLFRETQLKSLVVSTNPNLKIDTWDKVSRIDNFKNCLSELCIEEYLDPHRPAVMIGGPTQTNHPEVQQSGLLLIPNTLLSTLELNRVQYGNNLLYGCMNTLTVLKLFKPFEITCTLRLPKLKELCLHASHFGTAYKLLNACGCDLSSIDMSSIGEDTGSSTLESKQLQLQKLQFLSLSSIPFSLFTRIVDSTGIESLDQCLLGTFHIVDATATDSARLGSYFKNWKRISKFQGPLELFKALPEEVYTTLKAIRFINFPSNFVEVDNSTLSKLLCCSNTTELIADAMTSITAVNWLPKVLTSMPRIRKIDLERSKCIGNIQIDGVLTEECKHLEILLCELTGVTQKDMSVLLEHCPVIRDFGSQSFGISFNIFSCLLAIMDKRPTVPCFTMKVLPPDTSDGTTRCHYLHKQMRRITLSFSSEMSFEDMILACICATFEASKQSRSMLMFIFHGFPIFLQDYESRYNTYDSLLYSLERDARSAISSVINRIDGIDDKKRQEIIASCDTCLPSCVSQLLSYMPTL